MGESKTSVEGEIVSLVADSGMTRFSQLSVVTEINTNTIAVLLALLFAKG